ncbi:hypothetical protein [Mycolicibacterium sp. 120320]|uniref:hypothetical protein n=1 Tax=Mycolicibacterium sp. 120320 TaxID=3096110 RepID=UPI002ED9A389
MAWTEVTPERCEVCGAEFGPGTVLVGWRPGSPGCRTYCCRACDHITQVPADQIQHRWVRNQSRLRRRDP